MKEVRQGKNARQLPDCFILFLLGQHSVINESMKNWEEGVWREEKYNIINAENAISEGY